MRVDKVTGMTSLLYIHLIRFLRTHKQRGIFGSCEMSASQRSHVFWDVTLCRWERGSRRFEGTQCLIFTAKQSKHNSCSWTA